MSLQTSERCDPKAKWSGNRTKKGLERKLKEQQKRINKITKKLSDSSKKEQKFIKWKKAANAVEIMGKRNKHGGWLSAAAAAAAVMVVVLYCAMMVRMMGAVMVAMGADVGDGGGGG